MCTILENDVRNNHWKCSTIILPIYHLISSRDLVDFVQDK